MKTKKVTVTRTAASFSTAATYTSAVTLARAPWEEEDDAKTLELAEAIAREAGPLPREPRHLGAYTRDRKRN